MFFIDFDDTKCGPRGIYIFHNRINEIDIILWTIILTRWSIFNHKLSFQNLHIESICKYNLRLGIEIRDVNKRQYFTLNSYTWWVDDPFNVYLDFFNPLDVLRGPWKAVSGPLARSRHSEPTNAE